MSVQARVGMLARLSWHTVLMNGLQREEGFAYCWRYSWLIGAIVFDTGAWSKLHCTVPEHREKYRCLTKAKSKRIHDPFERIQNAQFGNGIGACVISPHGDANLSDNGKPLLQLCRSNTLCIASTFLQRRNSRKYTWCWDLLRQRSVIDFSMSKCLHNCGPIDAQLFTNYVRAYTNRERLKAPTVLSEGSDWQGCATFTDNVSYLSREHR